MASSARWLALLRVSPSFFLASYLFVSSRQKIDGALSKGTGCVTHHRHIIITSARCAQSRVFACSSSFCSSCNAKTLIPNPKPTEL